MIGANTSVSWPSGIGGKGNEGVSGLVRQTPGSIGYVELAYAKQNKLPVALIRNKAGKFVMPSLQSTTAAVEGAAAALAKDVRTPIVNAPGPDAYPISGLTFLLVYRDGKDPAKAKLMVDFLTWAMHEGQTMCEALDYARLPQGVIHVNEANIKTLTANGKPVFAAN